MPISSLHLGIRWAGASVATETIIPHYRAYAPSVEGRVVVIGAGGSGREIYSLALEDATRAAHGWTVMGLLDSGAPELDRLERIGAPLLGSPDDRELLAELVDARFLVAIGDGGVRRTVSDHLTAAGLRSARLIHPDARLGTDVTVEDGCVVYPGTILTTNVRLAHGVHVNVGCTISHDIRIGSFATLSPGVHLAGGVHVGRGATVGTGASVIPGVSLGDDCVVGAGAVVIRDVEPGTTVVGVPARPL